MKPIHEYIGYDGWTPEYAYIEEILRKYANDVIDRAVEIAMAEDIINNTSIIKEEPYSAVWRQIHKMRSEII